MPTHIALLRGINVGGRNKVAMADLRALATSLGYADVTTYIQSGNLLFSATGAGTDRLASTLADAIAGGLGVSPSVIVITREELAQVIAANPYPDEPSPTCVHAVFYQGEPGAEVTERVAAAAAGVQAKGSRDEAMVIGRVMYLRTPDGFGRSDLSQALLARSRGPVAGGTARNWATVTKLLALCDG